MIVTSGCFLNHSTLTHVCCAFPFPTLALQTIRAKTRAGFAANLMSVARSVYSLSVVDQGWLHTPRALRALLPELAIEVEHSEPALGARILKLVSSWELAFRHMASDNTAPTRAAYQLFVMAQKATGIWAGRVAQAKRQAKLTSDKKATIRAKYLNIACPERDSIFSSVMSGALPIQRAIGGDQGAGMFATAAVPVATLPLRDSLLSMLTLRGYGCRFGPQQAEDLPSPTNDAPAAALPAPALTPAASGFAAVPFFMQTSAAGAMSGVSGHVSSAYPPPATAKSLPAASVVFGGGTTVVPAADGSTFTKGGSTGHGGGGRTVKPFGHPQGGNRQGGGGTSSHGGGAPNPHQRVDMSDKDFTTLTAALRTYASRHLTHDQIRAACLSCYLLRRGPNGGKPPSGHKTRDCFHLRLAVDQATKKGLYKAKQ